ncbi:hypothetical protein BV25DRAFT_1925416 [Artomyces pyxidatus]|uniref:Uncharacterized protein n=1 Tax=Artomyces pyxidatus TaxID=48021 RepID=A0ACB8TKT2_9AGAM|nr:hypothetical protein BV25DRAFT_1925416 [Artomyces pyxidatus]
MQEQRTGSSGRDRSVSGDFEESDPGSPQDGNDQPAGKPGRKKNPKHVPSFNASQAARRDQNRIAQREFRLRKQQRIRDLEARVEILSGGKDEALSEMRNILKDLMSENQVLRNLLRSLSGFIGDGAGGLLPKLGWTLNDFETFINRSETDTAFESYQRRKQEGATGQTPAASGSQPAARKRTSEDEAGPGRAKRPRAPGERDDSERSQDGFPGLMMNTVQSNNTLYNPTGARASPQDSSLFSDLMRSSNGSPMFMPSSSSPVSGSYAPSSSAQVTSSTAGYQGPYLAPLNMSDGSMNSMSFVGSSGVPVQQQPPPRMQPPMEENEALDPKHLEAQKLISYHLDNYKRNSAYCLPASLRPTLVQRTVPHESVIDRIPHPELRDRLILLRGRFNLVDCLHDYATAVTIHGDDVLAHSNWEIGETWLRRYGFLGDQATLNICNKWRRERGLPELRLADIAPPEATAAA